MLRVPVTTARRLAISAQRLAGPMPRRRPTREEMLSVCHALRCLQLDPTSVVARSHLLVLFSRLGRFDTAQFDELAYGERVLFEYWAHEASYVLAEDLPLHRWEMRRHPAHPRAVRWWERNAALRAHILDRLRADGPLRAREIEDRSVEPWESTGWTNDRNVSRMLDFMWVAGQTGIASRAGGQRMWDLMERCLPPDAPDGIPGDAELTRRAALLALGALGIARVPHIRAHFTRGRYPGLETELEALRSDGIVERVEVEGRSGEWWMRAETELPGDWRGRTALLSPFDNLLCDRGRAEELFGFTHRLEIYTPKPKRQWGYFVLPILHGDRLIGRADLRIDRKAARLIAPAVHREDDAPRGKAIAKAVRRELERLAAWQGCTEIELGSVPPAWAGLTAA